MSRGKGPDKTNELELGRSDHGSASPVETRQGDGNRSSNPERRALSLTKSYPGFAQIVRRHFDADLITDADADEVLAHFTRNVREHFMTIR